MSVHPHARGDNPRRGRAVPRHDGPSPRAWGQRLQRGTYARHLRSIPTRVGTTLLSVVQGRRGSVHPHARGDNHHSSTCRPVASGPSPRAWGQPDVRRRVPLQARSIPTRVGTTLHPATIPTLSSVHPHARGDNPPPPIDIDWIFGPSPRAWGQPARPSFRRAPARSIPTRVGTTAPALRPGRGSSVHPHARGDNARGPGPRRSGVGPSPRAWGQRPSRSVRRARHRSIPTRVGTTLLPSSHQLPATVHPHARGDNRLERMESKIDAGPSPRAWGQRQRRGERLAGERSIPTRVGTTRSPRRPPRFRSVHPHARGDNCSVARTPSGLNGPSPRAWGQPPRPLRWLPRRRSIPTRVGTTPRGRPRRRQFLVHPHARGDNILTTPYGASHNGPSPRAWGQLPVPASRLKRIWSIPTRVGTTHQHGVGHSYLPVHPHARGDNGKFVRSVPSGTGPSPRAWGQR